MGEVGRIGPFRLLEKVGQGGTAEVFLALRDGDTELVVVKRLMATLEGHATLPQRLRREAHLASLLMHPNITRVLAAGDDDGRFYVAFERVDGETLQVIAEVMKRRGVSMPIELAVHVACALLDALSHAHALTDEDGRPLGVVHRDVSPKNVMLSFRGETKLIDFGIARADVDRLRTLPGMAMGTLAYFAPEQALGDTVDRRTDLYAVCAVLHELLAGAPLVAGVNASEILQNILLAEHPRISTLRSDVPVALDAVLARGLARQRGDRFDTAVELRRALIAAVPAASKVTPDRVAAFLASIFPRAADEAHARVGRLVALARGEPIAEPTVATTRYAGMAELEGLESRAAPPIAKTAHARPPPTITYVAPRDASTMKLLAIVGVLLLVVLGLVVLARDRGATREVAAARLENDVAPVVVTPRSEARPEREAASREPGGTGEQLATGKRRESAPTRPTSSSRESSPPRDASSPREAPSTREVSPVRAASPTSAAAHVSSPIPRLLASLERSPDDAATFRALEEVIRREALALPASGRDRVLARLNNAVRYPTLDAMKLAVRTLERAQRGE